MQWVASYEVSREKSKSPKPQKPPGPNTGATASHDRTRYGRCPYDVAERIPARSKSIPESRSSEFHVRDVAAPLSERRNPKLAMCLRLTGHLRISDLYLSRLDWQIQNGQVLASRTGMSWPTPVPW